MRVLMAGARFSGLDGVSLEAEKVAEGLAALGHEVVWLAGELEPWHEGIELPEMGLFTEEARSLYDLAFGEEGADPALEAAVEAAGARLHARIEAALEGVSFDLLLVQNAWAIPMQLPLAVALFRLWRGRGVPAIAHNHDYYWERPRFSKNRIPNVLERYFPPKGPVHLSINHAAIRELKRRRGMDSLYLPNVMPFERPLPPPDAFARGFRRAFGLEGKKILLQPTRLVPRKQVEKSVELAARLKARGHEVALVVSHPGADEGDAYPERIQALARERGVPFYWIGERVGPRRDEKRGVYALMDVYPNADLVTFPSRYEGFGNALLESVYAKKPLWVWPYPVYEEDIRPLGFRFFEPGAPIEQVEEALATPEALAPDLEQNYRLAREHFGYRRLISVLEEALREARAGTPL